MSIRTIQPIRLVVLAAVALTSTSCTQPDRWSVFRVSAESQAVEALSKPDDLNEPVELNPSAGDIKPQLPQEPEADVQSESGPLELSIEQAALLTLRFNQDLLVQQLNPVIVGTFEQIERGVFDPEIFAGLRLAEEVTSETDRGTGQQFGVEARDSSAVAGLRQTLPTGTNLEFSVEQDRGISDRTPEQQEARVGLTLTQSLLRGFGPAINLARVRQARIDTMASRYELQGFTQALLSETEIAYWNFVEAREEIVIFERSLEIARQQRHEVEQRIEVGLLPETEAAAARAEVARREQALIEARSILEARRLRLVRLINPRTGNRLDRQVIATSDLRIDAHPLADLNERVQLAERVRPDLNEARLRLQQNRLETMITRNGLMPRLEFFADLGQTGFGDRFDDSFREIREDERTYDLTVGLNFSHRLGNRAAHARDLAATTSRIQAARAVANLRQAVHLDVHLAANEVERARQQITASAATCVLAEQTYEAEKERFDVGSSTSILVSQAQRDLLASRIDEVRAVINYRIALVRLYLAEGSLLDRRGVRIAVGND